MHTPTSQMTATPRLTKEQFIQLGALSAINRECVIEACETRQLSGDARLFFEQGYFEQRLVPQEDGQSLVSADPISTN